MSTSSYRADAGTVQGHLDIARYITTPKGEIAGKVLAGGRPGGFRPHAQGRHQPAQEQLRADHRAAQRRDLDQGRCPAFTPDYSVEFLPTNPWIHQPFEGYDSLSPDKLLEKWTV
jgi:hypothetical protein